MKPPSIHHVRKPCKPGYEGKWCLALPNAVGIHFAYFDTKEEAEDALRVHKDIRGLLS